MPPLAKACIVVVVVRDKKDDDNETKYAPLSLLHLGETSFFLPKNASELWQGPYSMYGPLLKVFCNISDSHSSIY